MGLEIHDIQVSKPVMLLTDTVTVTFSVLNNTGAKVTVLNLGARLKRSAFGADSTFGTIVMFESDKKVSIAVGASQTFTYQFQPNSTMKSYFADYPDVHIVPVQLEALTYYSDGTATSVQQDFVQLYDGYYSISIGTFELTRCLDGVANDEGENVLADVKISLDDELGTDNASLRCYYAAGDTVDESAAMIDLTAHIPDALAGLTAAQIITEEFSNGSDWAVLLVLSNGYESVSARTSLARAFANVHLSGASTGGVAFGKFSAAQDGAPLFECVYPAKLLGGVHGVNIYAGGEALTGGVWIDGRPIYRNVLSFGAVAAGGNVQLEFGVEAGKLGTVISLRGMALNAEGSSWLPLPAQHITGLNYARDLMIMNADSDTDAPVVRVRAGSSAGILSGFVEIEYTKTE